MGPSHSKPWFSDQLSERKQGGVLLLNAIFFKTQSDTCPPLRQGTAPLCTLMSSCPSSPLDNRQAYGVWLGHMPWGSRALALERVGCGEESDSSKTPPPFCCHHTPLEQILERVCTRSTWLQRLPGEGLEGIARAACALISWRVDVVLCAFDFLPSGSQGLSNMEMWDAKTNPSELAPGSGGLLSLT